jgi:hypothetical protein
VNGESSAGLLHFRHANARESVPIAVSMIGFAMFSASSAICERHDIEAQIQRECVAHGLPEPSVMTRLPAITVGKQLREPLRFRRFRKKRDLEQPDRQGSFWRVQFVGLGLFRFMAD